MRESLKTLITNVWSVVCLSEEKNQQEKNGNAPVVEADTPNTEIKPTFDVEAIRKNIPKPFRGMIDPVIDWANSVEARFNALEQNLPGEITKAMNNAIEMQQRKQMEMLQNAAPQLAQSQGGGINLGSIMPLISMIAGGGSQDSEMQQMVKDMMSLNIKRMQADLDFTDSVKNAIVSKIAGKAAASLGEI